MKYDICVFGGCALDQFYYKNEKGEIPECPSLVLPGGKGSNQAVAAARAGAKVTMVSRLGKDSIGQRILENLVYNNITTNNIEVIDGLSNDYAKIVIDEKTKDNDIERFAGAIDSFTPEMIERYKKVFLQSKMVIAQLKVPKEVSVELINFCYDNNIPLVLTPCRPQRLAISEPGNKELIEKITYITANKKECETIFETTDIESCLEKYPNKLIVTLGPDGVAYHDGEKIVKIPAIEVDKVEDTTGAGDTFNGNFAAALIKGFTLYESVVKAQYASSMKIRIKGAQDGMPYEEELEKYMMNYYLDNHDYSREFDLAYNAIEDATSTINKKNLVKITFREKEDSTFVTESDLIVEKLLIDHIRDSFPDDNFVTEEFNNENTIQNRTWIIDPIDGTAHYMKKSIFWGIQLAFVDNGEIQFSIMYLPKLDEMFYAIKGKGAYLNHKRIDLGNKVPLNQSTIEFCGSCHKKIEEKKTIFEKLLNNPVRPANFMHINACCFAFSNLLTGRTNTLVLSTTKPWDIIPGVFMTQEAGINSYSISGLTIYSNTEDIEKFIKDE